MSQWKPPTRKKLAVIAIIDASNGPRTGEFSNSGLDKCLQILLNPSTKRILQRSKKNAARGRRQCSTLWQLTPGSDGVNF